MRRKPRLFRIRRRGKLSLKHYTWVTAFNHPCNLVKFNHCAPPVEQVFCCPSDGHIVLLSNSTLESSFEDTVRVVRIHGELRWAWDLSEVEAAISVLAGSSCSDFVNLFQQYVASFQGNFRSGLAVREVRKGDVTSFIQLNPMDDYDFSEGRWKLMKFHTAMPDNQTVGFFDCGQDLTGLQGVCSDVTGTSPGATTTECTLVPLATAHLAGSTGIQFPAMQMRSWSHRYNNKLRFGRLRENQQLVMDFGWANVDFANGQVPPPNLMVQGGLKLLLEVG